MSEQGSFSRRQFLTTVVAGACIAPFAGAVAEITGSGESSSAAAAATPVRPKLSYNSVKITSPIVALTFDDGPHGTLTPKLLDTLKARNVKGTFYLIGKNVEMFPDVAKRIVDEGHEVANHTWSHPSLSKLSAEKVQDELGRCHEMIEKVTGVTPANMRPPYGAVNDRVRQIAFDDFHYYTIMWSVDPLDWKYRNTERVRTQLVQGAAPGAILLCHDIHATTVAAIPGTLDQLLAKGFQFTTVHQLLPMGAPAKVAT